MLENHWPFWYLADRSTHFIASEKPSAKHLLLWGSIFTELNCLCCFEFGTKITFYQRTIPAMAFVTKWKVGRSRTWKDMTCMMLWDLLSDVNSSLLNKWLWGCSVITHIRYKLCFIEKVRNCHSALVYIFKDKDKFSLEFQS